MMPEASQLCARMQIFLNSSTPQWSYKLILNHIILQNHEPFVINNQIVIYLKSSQNLRYILSPATSSLCVPDSFIVRFSRI
jgi:hypothetical protein